LLPQTSPRKDYNEKDDFNFRPNGSVCITQLIRLAHQQVNSSQG
jgi:hypothetical protein